MNATDIENTTAGPSFGAALSLPGGGDRALAAIHEGYAASLVASEAEIVARAEQLAAQRVERLLEEGRRIYGVTSGVAIIPVLGSLVQSFPYVGYGGRTGYDVLDLQVEMASADPEVRGLAFWIKSPGGMVAGLYDLTDKIEAERVAHGKPSVAILDDYAYSAAYAIAATADQIAVPRMGGLGSIGALLMHVGVGRIVEMLGFDLTILRAGERKARGNPFEPLDEETTSAWQGRLDEARTLFAGLVGRNRARAGRFASDEEGAAAALATRADVWDGEEQVKAAVALGFADAIRRPDQALKEFIEAVN